MLCNSCKNKSICKHYEYFNGILLNITVQVTSCEMYSNNNQASQPIYNPDKRPLYREALPSLDVKEEVEDDEDVERVFINIDDYREPQNISIADMLLKGDK